MTEFKSKFSIKYPGALLSVTAAAAVLAVPILDNPGPNRALSLLVLAALLWITEAIPLALTALLIPVLAAGSGLLGVAQSFEQFANPVIFLFMGGFVLAGALSAHGLDRFMASWLVSKSGGNFYRAAILLMLATSLMASWIGNTSTAAMMLPLGLGLLTVLPRADSSAEAKFVILGIAYAANAGGVITLIGTPPNAIGAAILHVSFAQWLSYGVPMFLVTFPLMIALLTWYFKPRRSLAVPIAEHLPGLPPFARRLVAIFLLTVALWMLEGVLAPMLGIPTGFSALVAVLCIAMIFGAGILPWPMVISSIRWDVLLLFGGGLTLGIVVERSGLGAILIGRIVELAGHVPPFLFLWLVVLFCIALTEFMSNTASAALILPLLYSLASHRGTDPALLVIPATFAASYGFMLPVGTPPNAMAYGTGRIPQRDMLRIGLGINLAFSIVLTLLFHYVF